MLCNIKLPELSNNIRGIREFESERAFGSANLVLAMMMQLLAGADEQGMHGDLVTGELHRLLDQFGALGMLLEHFDELTESVSLVVDGGGGAARRLLTVFLEDFLGLLLELLAVGNELLNRDVLLGVGLDLLNDGHLLGKSVLDVKEHLLNLVKSVDVDRLLLGKVLSELGGELLGKSDLVLHGGEELTVSDLLEISNLSLSTVDDVLGTQNEDLHNLVGDVLVVSVGGVGRTGVGVGHVGVVMVVGNGGRMVGLCSFRGRKLGETGN